jgi:hypothetical protein
MLEGKRTLVLVLGFFFNLVVPLWTVENQDTSSRAAFSFSAEAGTLWVENDRAAGYWRNGLSIKKEKQFFLHFDWTQITSNLPWAEGDICGVRGAFGFDTSFWGFHFASGFFSHSLVNIEIEKKYALYSEGGQGFFFSFETPVHIGGLSITPSFLYGGGNWDNGSLYWFFGKPDISALSLYGLSARYHEQHTLGFYYCSLDADILSNEAVRLFNSHINLYIPYYQFSLKKRNTGFTGTAGWLYAAAAADGALTSSNQHYSWFPYVFFNIDGSLDAHIGFAMLDFKLKHSIFQYHIGLGAAHIFQLDGDAEIHSKMKKLFGGRETLEHLPLNIKGLGAAFMTLDFGIPDLGLGKKKSLHLSFGLKKAFILPWGYEQLLSDGTSDSTGSPSLSGDETARFIKTVLLSGISLYASLRW